MSKKIKKLITIIIVPLITAILGAWAGAENTSKAFRRYGIPILIITVGIIFKNYWSILLGSWIGIFSIGYGIPDSTDEGSTLGRFWYKITLGNVFLTNMMVGATIGCLLSIPLMIIASFRGSWYVFCVTASLCISVNALTPILNKVGTYELFGKELLWKETIIYGVVGLAGIMQVLA